MGAGQAAVLGDAGADGPVLVRLLARPGLRLPEGRENVEAACGSNCVFGSVSPLSCN